MRVFISHRKEMDVARSVQGSGKSVMRLHGPWRNTLHLVCVLPRGLLQPVWRSGQGPTFPGQGGWDPRPSSCQQPWFTGMCQCWPPARRRTSAEGPACRGKGTAARRQKPGFAGLHHICMQSYSSERPTRVHDAALTGAMRRPAAELPTAPPRQPPVRCCRGSGCSAWPPCI